MMENEELQRLDDERRKDLEKVYKFVKTCKLCKKKYGTDKKLKENGMCSACSRKYMRLTMTEGKYKEISRIGIENKSKDESNNQDMKGGII